MKGKSTGGIDGGNRKKGRKSEENDDEMLGKKDKRMGGIED